MNSQPPQVSTLNPCEVAVFGRQRALPVVLFADVCARPVEPVCPAVEAADERLAGPSAGVLGAVGGVDQPTAPVQAHVVVRPEFVWPRAHDDDRVVKDVVGEVVADLGDLLDPADLLPHLAPQLVTFGAGIVLGDVGLHPNGYATEVMDGRVSVLEAGGRTRVLRDDLPCANGITVHRGRLFINECRDGGRLMELDGSGAIVRVLAENLPSPNAMEVGPDGMLYYPLMTANEIWRSRSRTAGAQ